MQRDLVERAMNGDHDAFSELARVSVGRLLVIARLILHDEPAAEDATQEALLAAWRHIRGLRDPDRPRRIPPRWRPRRPRLRVVERAR
jgi:DNA-directed RNA polymerase specialized sigma24 family protein